jgi:hypothetical protein
MDSHQCKDTQTHLDEPGDSDSDLSQSLEEPGCLDAFEEITEQSELERFGAFLRDAQMLH